MENLISTMIAQHRKLQGDLGEVNSLLKAEKVNIEKISQELRGFARGLNSHLTLENEVFYPKLLKQMEADGENVSGTKEFILEMKAIEKVVAAFLSKFKDAVAIENLLADFKNEFSDIVSVLNLRIESEEDGVYAFLRQNE